LAVPISFQGSSTALAVPISFQRSLDGLGRPDFVWGRRDAMSSPACCEHDAHPVLKDSSGEANRAHPVNVDRRMLGAVFSLPMDIER